MAEEITVEQAVHFDTVEKKLSTMSIMGNSAKVSGNTFTLDDGSEWVSVTLLSQDKKTKVRVPVPVSLINEETGKLAFTPTEITGTAQILKAGKAYTDGEAVYPIVWDTVSFGFDAFIY